MSQVAPWIVVVSLAEFVTELKFSPSWTRKVNRRRFLAPAEDLYFSLDRFKQYAA